MHLNSLVTSSYVSPNNGLNGFLTLSITWLFVANEKAVTYANLKLLYIPHK